MLFDNEMRNSSQNCQVRKSGGNHKDSVLRALKIKAISHNSKWNNEIETVGSIDEYLICTCSDNPKNSITARLIEILDYPS